MDCNNVPVSLFVEFEKKNLQQLPEEFISKVFWFHLGSLE